LLVQNKVPKQKDTPSHVPTESPVLLTLMGVNQTRPDNPHKPCLAAELKQVIDEGSHEASAARRGSRGFVSQQRNSKANQDQNFKAVIPA
jgi:hypothetical protein